MKCPNLKSGSSRLIYLTDIFNTKYSQALTEVGTMNIEENGIHTYSLHPFRAHYLGWKVALE